MTVPSLCWPELVQSNSNKFKDAWSAVQIITYAVLAIEMTTTLEEHTGIMVLEMNIHVHHLVYT